MKLLIDTNVLIPMEPVSISDTGQSPEAVDLSRLCKQTGVQQFMHPCAIFDIQRDSDEVRRNIRQVQLRKYVQLDQPPPVTAEDQLLLGSPAVHSNDWVDNQLLAALRAGCVDYLVTNDSGIHQKARRLALEHRVQSLADTVQMLRLLKGEAPKPPPAVQRLLAYNLNTNDPIFETFRTDYPDFDQWIEKCKREHRNSWIIPGERDDYAGICIANDEGRQADGYRLLKICSFKVASVYSGFRFGELLLKTAFDYARKNGFQRIYLTVFDKYEPLILLMETFGFRRKDHRTDRGELILEKSMLAWDSVTEMDEGDLAYNVEHGPFVVQWARNRAFLIPIKPEYHEMLFPEAEQQLVLFESRAAYGNSIRKAYLCNSPNRRMRRGDLLMFYRSGDRMGVTALGVLEDLLVSTDPAAVTAFVGNRTVYGQADIKSLSQSGVLALLFRHARNLNPPLLLDELKRGGALRSAPQSIQQLRNGGYEWIRDRLMVR